jgi:hypothetical protein
MHSGREVAFVSHEAHGTQASVNSVHPLALGRLSAREFGHRLKDAFPNRATIRIPGRLIQSPSSEEGGIGAVPFHQETTRQMPGSSIMRQ